MFDQNITNFYLARNFLTKFLQIILVFFLIVFFVNLIETLDKVSDHNVAIAATLQMAFLRVFDFLNEIVISLVLLSSILSFFNLASKSEITVFKNCGMSMWHLIRPVGFAAFLLGVFWICVVNSVSISATKKLEYLEGKYLRGASKNVIYSNSGIWLKQANFDKKNEEIIIKAYSFDKNNMEVS